MDRVIGVSWPRSGHHLLVRLLERYFGDRFRYCDFYGGIEGCCKVLPCRRADVHLSKSHDFELDLPQIADRKYLIQYRAFVPSAVSNYELFLLQPGNGPDTPENFYRFASGSFTTYRGFVRKWVESDFGQAQQQLTYEQLIAWPKESLALAVRWIAPDEEPDEARIAEAVRAVSGQKVEQHKVHNLEGVGVHAERDVTQFRHYRAEMFDRLEKLALTRAEVVAAFQAVLGRAPAETNFLNFQCFETVAALEDHLRASDEYRRKNAAPAAPINSEDQ